MNIIQSPAPVDLAMYAPDAIDRDVYFGLPKDVAFCTRCVYSNQKPLAAKESGHTRNSKKSVVGFNEDGVCDACVAIESKKDIDWSAREEALIALCDRFRRDDGRYDCLVPGSGGKDSFYAAHILKYKYGMHPLTCTWSPHLYTDWGRRNFDAWTHAGFDNYLFTPNARVERLLTRLSLETILHPFQPFILGQYYFPPRMSAALDIPLVFYGEPPSDYGSPELGKNKAAKDLEYFTERDRSNVFMGGVEIERLTSEFGLSDGDLDPYVPPDPQLLEDKNIEVQYLGYYLPWHPQAAYYYSVEHGNFQAAPERSAGTYSKYSSIDDKIDDIHYYTTYIKFGIGRATYDAAQEVRLGDLTRDEAQLLVKRYDGEYPTRFSSETMEYLSIPDSEYSVAAKMFEQPIMDEAYFNALCDTFRSPHLWQYAEGEWSLRNVVWADLG